MANKEFRNELRIKYLKLLANNEEYDAFIKYFEESEQYINKIIDNQITPKASTLKDIIEVIKYRKSLTLNQKI